jgi:hypothetical protein
MVGQEVKAIVSNVGTTDCCHVDSIRERHRLIEVAGIRVTQHLIESILQPRGMEQFFRHFGAVDFHDHTREGRLAFELF